MRYIYASSVVCLQTIMVPSILLQLFTIFKLTIYRHDSNMHDLHSNLELYSMICHMIKLFVKAVLLVFRDEICAFIQYFVFSRMYLKLINLQENTFFLVFYSFL